MKNSFLYLLVILLSFYSCSSKDEERDIDEDNMKFEDYLEEWDMIMYYQDVSQSETYHLMETLIDFMDKNQMYFISFPSSDLNHKSVSHFNDYLSRSEEAVDFFIREDCTFVLLSTYLTSLDTERYTREQSKEYTMEEQFSNARFSFLELLLSSDIFMSKMNIKEKCQLMILALESQKYKRLGVNSYSFNIMISIMLSNNYTPFVNDVKPLLLESQGYVFYHLLTTNDYGIDGMDEVITKYARQFIKDNK